jgi:hypothetical protein
MLVLAGVVFCGVGACLGVYCWILHASRFPDLPETVAFPLDQDVRGVTAQCYNSRLNAPDTPEFEIPEQYVPTLLRMFRPCQVQPHLGGLQEAARLQVRRTDGSVDDVRLLVSLKAPLLFTFNGTPCIRGGRYKDVTDGKDKYIGESDTLEDVLRELHRIATDGKETDRFRESIRLLDRSAGRDR